MCVPIFQVARSCPAPNAPYCIRRFCIGEGIAQRARSAVAELLHGGCVAERADDSGSVGVIEELLHVIEDDRLSAVAVAIDVQSQRRQLATRARVGIPAGNGRLDAL